jgi:hypothetical protein
MNRGATILVLLLLTLRAGAVDQLLRERSVRPATSNYTTLGRLDLPFVAVYADGFYDHGVRLTNGGSGSSFTQTNISYVAVTNAPWQWGSVNLTNWSTLPTNVLLGFIGTNRIVTNTVWQRIITYSNEVYVPNASFDTNGTVFSWVADGGQYRIDVATMLETPDTGQNNNYEHDYGLYWTNRHGWRIDAKLFSQYDELNTPIRYIAMNAVTHNIYTHVGAYHLSPPAGATVTATNRAYISSSDGPAGTNYISIEVSQLAKIYTVSQP